MKTREASYLRVGIADHLNQIGVNKMTMSNEYRLYEHPVSPSRLIKRGFCWPALIVGPAWLLLKRLWVPTLVLLAVVAVAYHLNHHNLSDSEILLNCAYMEDYGEWVAHVKSGLTDAECVTRTHNIDLAILILAQLACAIFVNSLWERDLINRGYTLTKSLHARSIDDARAMLAREAGTHSNQESDMSTDKHDQL